MCKLVCFTLLAACIAFSAEPAYRCGVARRDVTPPLGTVTQGHTATASKRILDPLLVRAMVIADGQRSVALVDADLIGYTPEFIASIKQRLAQTCGIRPEDAMLMATHEHTGPKMIRLMGEDPPDPVYQRRVSDAVVDAVREAGARAERCSLALSWSEAEIGINRRLPGPKGVEFLPNPAGFVDKQVGVLWVRRLNGSFLGMLVNYACHPTTLNPEVISADYPGRMKRAVEAKFPGATCLFANGAYGDIRPRTIDGARWRPGTENDIEQSGRTLAEAVIAAAPKARPLACRTVRGEILPVKLPYLKMPTEQQLQDAMAAARAGDRQLEWAQTTLAQLRRGKLEPELAVELQLIQFGEEFAVAWVPGEFLSEGGVGVKSLRPGRMFVTSCAVWGYIPCDDAVRGGGYEPAVSYRSYGRPAAFGYGTCGRIVDAFRKGLK